LTTFDSWLWGTISIHGELFQSKLNEKSFLKKITALLKEKTCHKTLKSMGTFFWFEVLLTQGQICIDI